MQQLTQQQTIGALIAIARAADRVLAEAPAAAQDSVAMVDLDTALAVLDGPSGEGASIDLAESRLKTLFEPVNASHVEPMPANYHATTSVPVRRIVSGAFMPRYSTDGSGCFDLFTREAVNLHHGKPQVVDLGLAFEIPRDHVMLIFSRSGHGFKLDTRLANCVGVIDSDYRGSVKVKLTCDDPDGGKFARIEGGAAIAQAIILPYPRINFVEVDTLTNTARGAGGFGSTDTSRPTYL